MYSFVCIYVCLPIDTFVHYLVSTCLYYITLKMSLNIALVQEHEFNSLFPHFYWSHVCTCLLSEVKGHYLIYSAVPSGHFNKY